MIVNSKRSCGQPLVTKLIHTNRSYTGKASIAHQLNTHFINVGHELADKLPITNENVNQYIKRSFRDSDVKNFMIIKSARKRDMEISLNISNSDGSSHVLERKQCIKYLGVMIDESLTWKHHIAFVCSRISRNIGIMSKLRYCLSIQQ